MIFGITNCGVVMTMGALQNNVEWTEKSKNSHNQNTQLSVCFVFVRISAENVHHTRAQAPGTEPSGLMLAQKSEIIHHSITEPGTFM